MSPNSSTTQVILVRHGRSTYNAQGRYQGCSDDSILTTQGRHNAYQTGLFLKSFPLDAIYTSPLQRVQQTTSEITAALSTSEHSLPTPQISDRLKEVNLAAWEGLTYEYVRRNCAEDYRCWQESPQEFRGRDGSQPIQELYHQAQLFWQEILAQHGSKTVLVVSHGGTNRALISTAIGIQPSQYHHLQQCNCGVSLLEFTSPESPAQLTAFNLTSHLGKALPKLYRGQQGLRLLLLSSETTAKQAQNLARYIPPQSLNFILSTDLKQALKIAEPIAHEQISALHLQVQRHDWTRAWRQVLQSRSSREKQQSQTLTTGLVIAQPSLMAELMPHSCSHQTVKVEPGTMVAIHYPQMGRQPIWQTLLPNWSQFGPGRKLIQGVQWQENIA